MSHQKLDRDRVNQRGFGNAAPMNGNSLTGDAENRIGCNTKVTKDDATFAVNMERISPY